MVTKEIEFTADELWTVRSVLAAAGGVQDHADLEHRLRLIRAFTFREDEHEHLNYREIISAGGQPLFQFNKDKTVIRRFTPRQTLKLRIVIGDNLGMVRGDKLAVIKSALLRLGCDIAEFSLDEEEEDDAESETDLAAPRVCETTVE